MTIIKLQKIIKNLLSTMGWTKEAFIERYVSERCPELDHFDPEYEEEVRKMTERLKKHLYSSIKKPDHLQAYIEFIKRQPEYSKIDVVIPTNYSEGSISDTFDNRMEKISEAITKHIKDDK